MTIATTRCRDAGHAEFLLKADETQVPETSLQELARTIEDLVSHGTVFQPGETFQVGWMTTRIESGPDGALTLHEPDLKSLPIAFVPGVTQTLRTMMLQTLMLDSVGLREQMSTVSMIQTAMVCTAVDSGGFMMHRFAPRGDNDSGWYIGCLRDDHDHENPANVELIGLYQAVLRQRTIENFLTFPEECTLYLSPAEGLRITRHNHPLPIRTGSFLDRLQSR